MKNIAIIVQHLANGGAERVAGMLSIHLSTKYNVYLFLCDISQIVYDYKGKIMDLAIDGDGFEYIEYNIKKYKRECQIDCAISFLEPCNFMNIRTKGKECVIISERSTQSLIRPKPYCEDADIRRLYNYADGIVSVSDGVKYDLVNSYGVKSELIRTIYNFIDKEKISQKAEASVDESVMNFIGDSKLILNVGRLADQKNQRKLIVQFAKLLKSGENVKLLILGSGDLQDELVELCEEKGVTDFVKIVNYLSNPFPFYRLASMFVLTSIYEGLPNVVLEAMYLKVPVVAVDCLSGPRELLLDDSDYGHSLNGFIVGKRGILVQNAVTDDDGSTDILKQAMSFLIQDNELREHLIREAYCYMEQYSNEELLDKWMEVVENTVSLRDSVPVIRNPKIEQATKLIVYGAGFIGKQVMQQYIDRHGKPKFIGYAVTHKEGIDEIDGIPVFEIDKLTEYRKDAVVAVGVSDKYSAEVVEMLKYYHFENIEIPVLENKLLV